MDWSESLQEIVIPKRGAIARGICCFGLKADSSPINRFGMTVVKNKDSVFTKLTHSQIEGCYRAIASSCSRIKRLPNIISLYVEVRTLA
jgi:hypothetical protein